MLIPRYSLFKELHMLELFVKPIFEVITFFIKNAGTNIGYKKSSRAVIRLYWLLSKLEKHSETLVEALEVVRDEKRIPSRFQVAVENLYEDIKELEEMIAEDRFGYYTGFWCIWEVFGESSKQDFENLIGIKLQRLQLWKNLLKQTKEQSALVVASENFAPPPMLGGTGFYLKKIDYSFSKLKKNNQIQVYKFTDLKQLDKEIVNSKSTIDNIRKIKAEWKKFIKSNYEFEDLF